MPYGRILGEEQIPVTATGDGHGGKLEVLIQAVDGIGGTRAQTGGDGCTHLAAKQLGWLGGGKEHTVEKCCQRTVGSSEIGWCTDDYAIGIENGFYQFVTLVIGEDTSVLPVPLASATCDAAAQGFVRQLKPSGLNPTLVQFLSD